MSDNPSMERAKEPEADRKTDKPPPDPKDRFVWKPGDVRIVKRAERKN